MKKITSGQIIENKSSFYYNRMAQYFEGRNSKGFCCFCSSFKIELNQRVLKSTNQISLSFLTFAKEVKGKNADSEKTVNKSPYYKEA